MRSHGWQLCRGHHGARATCKHVLLCDLRPLAASEGIAIAEADQPAWRMIMLGAEEPATRAALIKLGCAEALPAATGSSELAVRAARVADMFDMLPRWREIGPLTLDLFHRDARSGANWLRLHPREFGVLWRLADDPGEPVTREQLLRDVWRLNHIPETNSVEVHVARLRSKLAANDCSGIVVTDPRGGYRLEPGAHGPFMLRDAAHGSRSGEDRLDAYLRTQGLQPASSDAG
ncbi:winged helix-turn-helix domain-containing protein [Paraurantiacibacter namhicola]|uniref:winged helix-turn-helix domain-containing protein n=1 Tax=Paraurantiacibacter namhicola TaxID=645517 RepID=UPI001F158B59|nr:winged helix-turn-helix domain-containing protein [Paraurantiacibacter namhicola]